METDARRTAPTYFEIGENGWLACGLLWMIAGALTIVPLIIAARLGRLLLELMLLVHTIEAGYVTVRTWVAGLNMRRWFLRTIVLGSLAVFALETSLRRTVSQKESA